MRDIGAQLRARGIDLDLTANVHGAFGKVADWPVLRSELNDWLQAAQAAVQYAAHALADVTPHADAAGQAATECSRALIGLIDDAVNSAAGHEDLSQRLAEVGVLPMFGFPSSVRYLHLWRPYAAYPWPPKGTIDRDIAMAVAVFAPLSEVVRDGRVYPVVGIAAFEPVRPRPQPDPDPLGPERAISVCRACAHLDEQAVRLGRHASRRRSLPAVRRRAGFLHVHGHARAPRLQGRARARTSTVPSPGRQGPSPCARSPTWTACGPSEQLMQSVTPGRGRRFVINDNGGALFTFRQAAAWRPGLGRLRLGSAIDQGTAPGQCRGRPTLQRRPRRHPAY